MAGYSTQVDPWAGLAKQMPRKGPYVQNSRGFAPNTAPLGQRPLPTPGVKLGSPGPAPLSPSPNPTGLASTPQQAPAGGGAAPPPMAPPPTGGIEPTPQSIPGPGANPRRGGGGGGGEGGNMPSLPMELYGRSGGTYSQSVPGSLESQIRDYISGATQGSVSQDFINRAKGDVFRQVQGQTRQGENQINEDAIRRGLFRSGIPAEGIAGLQGQAQSAMARGVADVLNNAENQNIQGRLNAAQMASGLLGTNREWDQYTQQRIDAEKARQRAAAGANATFTYIDPDTGQSYELPESMF